MSSLEDILERYAYSGVNPLEDWETEDLVELGDLISAELQDRAYRAQEQNGQ